MIDSQSAATVAAVIRAAWEAAKRIRRSHRSPGDRASGRERVNDRRGHRSAMSLPESAAGTECHALPFQTARGYTRPTMFLPTVVRLHQPMSIYVNNPSPPGSGEAPSINLQSPKRLQCSNLQFGFFLLDVLWCLDVGIWNFIKALCLCLSSVAPWAKEDVFVVQKSVLVRVHPWLKSTSGHCCLLLWCL